MTSSPLVIERRDWFGVILLFLVMMISGGNHLFPRNPICLLIIAGYGLKIYRLNNGITLKYVSSKLWLFITTFLVIIVSQTILGGDLDSAALAALSSVIAGLFVYTYYKYEGINAFINDVTILLKIFIVLGLISFLLYTFTPDLFSKYTFIDSYGDKRSVSHIAFLFYKGLDIQGFSSRLYGFFWEPGIFQIYLNIFLLIQIFYFRQKLWIVATLLAIYLTKSTTGYLIAIIILGYISARFFYKERNLYSSVSILCTTIIALFFVWNNIVSVNVEEKVAGAQSGSFFVRQADVIAGLSIAAENPVIGIGANTDRFKQKRSKIAWQGKLSGSKTKDSGTTNGIISLMYIWGIPFSLWYLWALIRQNILYKNRWLMAILLILSLSSEPLAMTPFFLLFVYSGLDAKTINN